MLIKYRPHWMGATIGETTEEEKTFKSMDEMFDYIVKGHGSRDDVITKEDLSVTEDHGKDDRIGWKESRYVCTRRMGDKVYDTPQCIGYCSFESEVHTNWTEATTNPSVAMLGLVSCLEARKNAWIEVRKNGDQEYPIKKKNPDLNNPFNWQFNYGVARNEKELAETNFFNETEKDLTYNWIVAFGTKEAIEEYQKNGTISEGMFEGMDISHPVRIKDANRYRSEIKGDNYKYGFFVDHWKPKDGIPYWVLDDSIDKVFTICYTNDPVDKKEALMRAGRFLIYCAEDM